MSHARIPRALCVLAAVVLTAIVGCVDAPTGPQAIRGAKAPRDTVEGDSTACRSGYNIVLGRIVCRES
jgi:hypothetical protein